MRHFLGGLGEHEAAPRVGAIEPPAREIVEQGFVVELRIVAAQGELEAVLALGRAVTRSRGAAHLIEDGRYVAQERDFGRVGGEGRGDEKRANTASGNRSLTVAALMEARDVDPSRDR